VVWQGRQGSAMGEGQPTSPRSPVGNNNYEYRDRPNRASTWQDDLNDRGDVAGVSRSNTFGAGSRANQNETFDNIQNRTRSNTGFDSNYSDKPKPARPTAPKPLFGAAKRASLAANQAIAKFTFDGEQPGDLSFKKGEIITIIKRTENETDWWTGKVGDKEGIFPSNYVETV